MKKLILLPIILINFAFTDEIHMTVKTLFTSYDEILEDIEIESITGSRVYYKNRDSMSKTLGCSVVNEMIIEYNGQRKIYEFDCTKNNNRRMIINELFGDEMLKNEDGTMKSLEQIDPIIYQPTVLTKVYAINKGRGRLGGALIAVGGYLLYLNLDKEMNDDETIEDFMDRVNGTAKLGYGFIIVGGVLVAVGI